VDIFSNQFLYKTGFHAIHIAPFVDMIFVHTIRMKNRNNHGLHLQGKIVVQIVCEFDCDAKISYISYVYIRII